MPILFKILRTGNDFSVKADNEPSFYVGRRVPYQGKIGLYNIFSGSKLEKLNFTAGDFAADFGFWAEFIEPTALCEGRNFLTLNTYDRAAFTFGFGQFAAHVPNGDFVHYFRAILGLPNATDYFPHLDVVNGRITKTDGPAPITLEDDESTTRLMKYLNPDLSEVQDAEVIAGAKLIHISSKHGAARQMQVKVMTDTYKTFMKRADKRVGINGKGAHLCCIIADILHHGRGGSMTWPLIDSAMKSSNPYAQLLAIGKPHWNERLKTLKNALDARPHFKVKTWSSTAGAFV